MYARVSSPMKLFILTKDHVEFHIQRIKCLRIKNNFSRFNELFFLIACWNIKYVEEYHFLKSKCGTSWFFFKCNSANLISNSNSTFNTMGSWFPISKINISIFIVFCKLFCFKLYHFIYECTSLSQRKKCEYSSLELPWECQPLQIIFSILEIP